MEQPLTKQNEAEKKGSLGKFIRTGVLFIVSALILLTFIMAIYRKFGS
jgi:hypothetical protein